MSANSASIKWTMKRSRPVQRGCGTRKFGKVYWDLGTGPLGAPLESFLVDPPIIHGMKLAPQGVMTIQQITTDAKGNRKVVWHLLDHVGSENYPNVADFLEEMKEHGLSRLIPRRADIFRKLSKESRLLLCHDRAFVEGIYEYREWKCPKGIEDHLPGNLPEESCCAGIWWQDVTGGTEVEGSDDPRLVERKLPSVSYKAHKRPDGVRPIYHNAIFASMPCGQFVVIEGEDHEKAVDMAKQSPFPVIVSKQ